MPRGHPGNVAPRPGKAGDQPVPTGSPTVSMTIGMVLVACLAAVATWLPTTTMASTGRFTRSTARLDSRSVRPSTNRYSMTMSLPSVYPSCRSPSRNPPMNSAWVAWRGRPSQPTGGPSPPAAPRRRPARRGGSERGRRLGTLASWPPPVHASACASQKFMPISRYIVVAVLRCSEAFAWSLVRR